MGRYSSRLLLRLERAVQGGGGRAVEGGNELPGLPYLSWVILTSSSVETRRVLLPEGHLTRKDITNAFSAGMNSDTRGIQTARKGVDGRDRGAAGTASGCHVAVLRLRHEGKAGAARLESQAVDAE